LLGAGIVHERDSRHDLRDQKEVQANYV
jgi:hypothetical protein